MVRAVESFDGGWIPAGGFWKAAELDESYIAGGGDTRGRD